MILTADDMGDPVTDVVNHVAEQVEWLAVRADNDKVFDVVIGTLDGAQNLVFVGNFSFPLLNLEADDIRYAPGLFLRHLLRSQVPAGAVIADVFLGRHGRLPLLVKFFLCAEAFIGVA